MMSNKPSLKSLVIGPQKVSPPQHDEPTAASVPTKEPEAPRAYVYTTPPYRQGKKPKTIYLEPEAMRQLKKIAADEDTNVEALILEGVNTVFHKRNLPQLAK